MYYFTLIIFFSYVCILLAVPINIFDISYGQIVPEIHTHSTTECKVLINKNLKTFGQNKVDCPEPPPPPPVPKPDPCPGIIEELTALREKYNEVSNLLVLAQSIVEENQKTINGNGAYIGSVLKPTLQTSIEMHGPGNPAAKAIEAQIKDLRAEMKELATMNAKLILAAENDQILKSELAKAIAAEEAATKKFKCKLPPR